MHCPSFKHMQTKIGIGYDIHRLKKGRKLFLGGVPVSFPKGLDGHSDADVLLHAICDALLGALGKGDIGEHFPNTDKKYKGISSVVLLKEVGKLLVQEGYVIGNIDSVVIAEAPHLKAYKPKMRKKIADALLTSPNNINIKATTQEGLGFGSHNKEAMAAYATALIVKE